MSVERQKTIQGVRDKAATLAEELNGRDLMEAKPYFNWEVCALLDEIDELREALTSIASPHKPRHDSEEYWAGFDAKTLATVLATDTKIARNALLSAQE